MLPGDVNACIALLVYFLFSLIVNTERSINTTKNIMKIEKFAKAINYKPLWLKKIPRQELLVKMNFCK
jgi:hypothetical protein